jgi:DNA-binding IclR family transcriptional regulator
MSTIVERSYRILDELATHPKGRTLSELAEKLDIPPSATHRLLKDLIDCGYVRKDDRLGEFTLTMQVVSVALRFLSASGIADIAQPALERLAMTSGELVRLAMVDADQLIYVAKAQGAAQGLRYDPEMGRAVRLACSAAGFVWLSTKKDDEALRLLALQGLCDPDEVGPAAPRSIKEVMTNVRATRKRKIGLTMDVFLPGMSSMAAPVYGDEGKVLAILIIAGPMARLSEQRMNSLAPALIEAADELSRLSGVSPMFKQPVEKALQRAVT